MTSPSRLFLADRLSVAKAHAVRARETADKAIEWSRICETFYAKANQTVRDLEAEIALLRETERMNTQLYGPHGFIRSYDR